jgi:AraC-like DNA-binding protein
MVTKSALIRPCRARDTLRETHDRRLSIEEVAREAAVSPFHFIRLFHAMFGPSQHCRLL